MILKKQLVVIVFFSFLVHYGRNEFSEHEKVCTGTNSGGSGSRNDYKLLKAIYSGCVYVDGNLEIANFNPDTDDISMYNFSFLDSIREITGYLLIFNTYLKSLRLKNLQIIRGKNLFSSNYSIFIASNKKLERLDLSNLSEVQRGSSFIVDNPSLCNMNEVLWEDIINDHKNNRIHDNAYPYQCSSCRSSCCPNNSSEIQMCGCWSSDICQRFSRLKCNSKCDGRCFDTGKFDCCNKECVGGCSGPTSKDCVACKKFQILETGECVDSCPRIKMVDTITGELVYNPTGMYQYGINCVRSCPKNLFVYQELCLTKCPKNTNEQEEFINNPVTGEKGFRRICKPCEGSKCKKTCSTDQILNQEQLNSLKDCEVFNGNLIISESISDDKLLTEESLEVLSSIRIVNGYIRINLHLIKSINFLRNLEIIRAPFLDHSKYSLIISGRSLRFLSLKNLRSIEKGDIVISAENLCLHDTINWESITKRKNSINFKMKSNSSCGEFKCHPACEGCWSPDQNYCQFCKNYKLEDLCIERCDGNLINNRHVFVENKQNRLCQYCHTECKDGCFGQNEEDCFSCSNYFIKEDSKKKCVNKCPSTHYANFETKECLPCASSCYGCKGPKETIDEKGCTNCNSALVDNDISFTIFKCILWNNTCPHGYFHDVVDLKAHPLKGRDVCRKCHKECDGCEGNGKLLNDNGCIQCQNFYSKTMNECVENCSIHNEFLTIGSNICSACNEECKHGCHGTSIYECSDCRGFKLKLNDVKKMVNLYTQTIKTYQNNSQKIELAIEIVKQQSANEIELTILENYAHLTKRETIENELDDIVFCIKNCPDQFPFTDSNFFCTSNNIEKKSKDFLIIFVAVFSILLIILLSLLLIIIKKSINKKLRILSNEKESYDYSSDNSDLDNQKVNMTNLILFNDNELEQCTFLGKGAFGIVYSGFYVFNDEKKKCKLRVAIKKLNYYPKMNKEKIKELENEIINEATLMASVNHKYCLKLMGLCIAQPIKIVTQLIPKGSVVTVLQKNRNELNEKNLLIWAQQIAEGMEYLESKGIVHRDLAARNILVKELDHIKITDFGLAKVLDSEEKAFYAKSNSLLPIKWLAIESIQNKIFTHESDVWSYGICLWEIFTFCAKPYAEIETINILNYLKKGVRLAQPKIASIEVYANLLKCWLENPYSRPSFKELNSIFFRMSTEPKNYLSFKSHTEANFITINQNTDAIIRQIQGDTYDLNSYEEDDFSKNKSDKKSNNNSLSPDEGIELNSIEVQSDQSYQKEKTLSNYNNSLVIFKRSPKIEINKRLKQYEPKVKRNKSLLTKLIPKRFASHGSNTTTSTYVSSVFSNESNRIIRQSDSLNYDEHQSLFTSSSSNLPTRSDSSNSSSIYNYNSKFKDINSNCDYLEPIMPNIKQNLEYFDDPVDKHIKSTNLMKSNENSSVPKIINKNPYYNDSLI